MQPDIQDEATVGRREYAFAKAYTEARNARRLRVAQAKFCASVLLVLMPLGYAALLPVVTDDLNAGWFFGWAKATAWLPTPRLHRSIHSGCCSANRRGTRR